MVDERNTFDHSIRNATKLYGNIRENVTAHKDDYTTTDYLIKVISRKLYTNFLMLLQNRH